MLTIAGLEEAFVAVSIMYIRLLASFLGVYLGLFSTAFH
jgi:hypothetical protein